MDSSLLPPRAAVSHASGTAVAGLFLVVLVLVLGLGDLFFIVAQGLGVPWRPVPILGFREAMPAMALDHDGGIPEWYGYGKEAFVALGFLALFRRDRAPILLGLSVTYALILLDDGLSLHERGGMALALRLGLPPVGGVTPDDIGELLLWGTLGGGAAGSLALGTFLSSPAERRRALPFLLAFGALLFFAVGVDAVHAATVSVSDRLERLFRIIEDGGELVVLTASCGLVVRALAGRTADGVSASAAPPGSPAPPSGRCASRSPARPSSRPPR